MREVDFRNKMFSRCEMAAYYNSLEAGAVFTDFLFPNLVIISNRSEILGNYSLFLQAYP